MPNKNISEVSLCNRLKDPGDIVLGLENEVEKMDSSVKKHVK